ncbi:MAG: iron-containing alcohol dehydrogenase [Crocinitomicaceae bacterium]|nr:iron-containing alcohol dehydrogenase [Crocinitomicaceae bacterium]
MNNFEAYNPTRIVFGKDQYHRINELMTEQSIKKVLLVYGGGSIKKNGIYDQVMAHLANFSVVEFGGVEANPEYSTLMKAVEIVKKESIDFILAVGGGSVIDGVKFIVGAALYDGEPWDVLERKPGCKFTNALPFGVVLTLPATGSEANSSAVINRSELKMKRTLGGPNLFPIFSICNPQVVASLPKRQIVNGIVDSFMHTLEQYLTYPSGNLLQQRQAESILQTLVEIAPKILENPSDYEAAANLMWCSTHALNGNLRAGVPTDWCTHMIGHELTAFYGIDHARTLAIIAPRLFENQFDNKFNLLVQYGKRVWNLSGDDKMIANQAITKTESFFQQLGIQTKISDYTTNTAFIADEIKNRFIDRGWTGMGERKAITPDDVKEIVLNAI